MKKIIIIAAVILSSALTALSLNRKPTDNNAEISKLKSESAAFAMKNIDAPKADLASGD